jgi:glycosyltransferase involved in cell wall biosynthesis
MTASRPRAIVCFAVNAIAHYRERFFELLKIRLEAEGIELRLLYGRNYRAHNIAGCIPWAIPLPLRAFGSLTWLSVFKASKDSDLLVIPQVLKHLWIYPLLLRHRFGMQKIALWGHGKLFTARSADTLAARIKKTISRCCDWWFAYTEISAAIVRNEIGFEPQKITVVNNAVDTSALAKARAKLSEEDLLKLRNSLGIRSQNVGIFVGGMYHFRDHTKRLPFLIDACLEIRKRLPDFEMIFIGGGPDQRIVEQAASRYPWIHYPGIRKGIDAVPYWALARVCLNPGLVGLGILDCMALGVPLITSNMPYHSPEISYLENGVNGLMVDDHEDPSKYAAHVISLICDSNRFELLIQGGRKTASLITNEAMVERVTDGILKALRLNTLS